MKNARVLTSIIILLIVILALNVIAFNTYARKNSGISLTVQLYSNSAASARVCIIHSSYQVLGCKYIQNSSANTPVGMHWHFSSHHVHKGDKIRACVQNLGLRLDEANPANAMNCAFSTDTNKNELQPIILRLPEIGPSANTGTTADNSTAGTGTTADNSTGTTNDTSFGMVILGIIISIVLGLVLLVITLIQKSKKTVLQQTGAPTSRPTLPKSNPIIPRSTPNVPSTSRPTLPKSNPIIPRSNPKISIDQWPSAADYNIAVQNPSISFSDSYLRYARPKPKPDSLSYAGPLCT